MSITTKLYEHKSPAGTMWLYDEAGLRALFASIKEELE